MKVREQSETIARLQRENNSLRHSLAVSTNASYMHAMNGSSTGTGTGNNATVDGRRATETSGGGPCSDSADANTKHAASSGESCENGSRYDGNGEEEALMDLSMQYPDDLHHHIAAAVAEADELDNSVCYASIPIPIGVDDDATGRAGEGNGAGVGVDVTSMMFEEEKTEAELDAEAEAEMNRMLGLHMYMRDADADADAEYGIAGEMYGENHDSGEGGAERLDLTLKSFHGFEDVESGPHHAYTGDENGLAITSVAGADAGIEAAGDADADDIDVSFLRDLELADEVHTFICVDEEEKDYTEAITPKFDPLKEQEEAGSSMALLHIGGIDEGDEAGDDAVVQIAVSVDTRGDVGIDVC